MEQSLAPTRLRETIVKTSSKAADWPTLEAHLSTLAFTEAIGDELLGHIRRCNELIVRYPDQKRQAKCDAFFQSLKSYLTSKVGQKQGERIAEMALEFEKIGAGYREILETLSQAPVAALSPERRVAAGIVWSTRDIHGFIRHGRQVAEKAAMRVVTQGGLLRGPSGELYAADAILTAVVEGVTKSIIMEARRHGWADEYGNITFPGDGIVEPNEVEMAEAFVVLAMCWRRWEHIEQALRYLGGRLEEYAAPNIPTHEDVSWQQFYIYRQGDGPYIQDFVANERLFDRLMQTYMEMTVETNMQQKVAPELKNIPMPPNGYVSTEEIHGLVSLSETVSYSIDTDTSEPGGLTIVEWLRGYAVLNRMAGDILTDETSQADFQTLRISRSDLVDKLVSCGLDDVKANLFIQRCTLTTKSRDLFDCPLMNLADGSLLFYAPAHVSANPSRITLSMIANQGESLSKKGKAFERYMLKFFQDQNLPCVSFKFKRDGEEYEYDLVVLWDDHVFLFECKTHSLSYHDPIQAYYFEVERQSDKRQVQRLAFALKKHPEILDQHLGVGASTKKLITCVLNALPFSLPGEDDGVYFTDASVVARFFADRYLFIKQPIKAKENVTVLHREAVKDIWQSDRPTAKAFLKQLDFPQQIEIITEHLELTMDLVPFSEKTGFKAETFRRKPVTIDSMCKLYGVNAAGVKRSLRKHREKVLKIEPQLKLKEIRQEAHSTSKRERVWRANQRREQKPS